MSKVSPRIKPSRPKSPVLKSPAPKPPAEEIHVANNINNDNKDLSVSKVSPRIKPRINPRRLTL
ncbi:hypothetical protein [Bartonella bilalgolemii]|uniref:Uncharacterized protein n=1 Tax=Bartonella bilalgolemii TaxID=2942911 RepID=A0ABT0P8M7_9HYPH|nr:hypothetical protein [Bartonella sp. G70]MCL6229103.1 hypothetical protein [Bartonella sp. G70]